MFLGRFQLALQPRLYLLVLCQGGFELVAPLANLLRSLFGTFPLSGLLGKRFGQPLYPLLHLHLGGLQLLDPGLQLGLFGTGTFPLRVELFLRLLDLLAQLPQLSLQLAALLANLTRSLLGSLALPGLFGQRFGQPLDLLLNFGLGRL